MSCDALDMAARRLLSLSVSLLTAGGFLPLLTACRSGSATPADAQVVVATASASAPMVEVDAGGGDAGSNTLLEALTRKGDDPAKGPVRCHSDAGAAKGRFISVSRHAAFEADRVGGPDGGLDPDGYKDVVIDVDFDGALIGFSMKSEMSSMEAGTGWGRLEVWPTMPGGVQKHVAMLIVYDKDVDKDMALNQRAPKDTFELGDGRHHLGLRLSGYYVTPKVQWRIFALRPDCTVVEGPSIR